jgi:hypothetical protein
VTRRRSPRGPWQTRGTTSGGDRGSATVELAIALPAVVVVLAAVLGVAAAAATHLSCADGARAAAREAALGSSDAQIVAVAQHVAGSGASVVIDRDAVWVRVEVRRPAVTWFAGTGGPFTATGSATARVEP